MYKQHSVRVPHRVLASTLSMGVENVSSQPQGAPLNPTHRPGMLFGYTLLSLKRSSHMLLVALFCKEVENPWLSAGLFEKDLSH